MTDAAKISIEDQVACVERELRQRARVYPRLVEQGKMTINQSRLETARMEAVRDTLQDLAAKGRLI